MIIMKKKSDSLSGFTCLVLTALSCIVSVFTRNYYTHALFMVWLSIVLSYFGFLKQGMLYLMLYVFTTIWLTQAVPKGIMIISPMLLSMMYTFILPVSAAYLTFHIPSGKLIAVFQKMRIPKNMLLVLIIIVRFIPTISNEVRGIKEAMKVRGFIGSARMVLLHPFRTMEYAVVPLIFRSIKIGDELAAAAIVRGIENPANKQSYYETQLGKTDIVLLTGSLFLSVLCVVM